VWPRVPDDVPPTTGVAFLNRDAAEAVRIGSLPASFMPGGWRMHFHQGTLTS